jgi:prephenate dehydrogenase
MFVRTLTIVGVGLIGGSIGLAARRRSVVGRILGVGRNTESLQRAGAAGAIDEAFLEADAAVHQADVAVFCTPVDLIPEQVLALAPGCRPGTLLTDAGSTKAAIVRHLDGRLPPQVAFVGGHPLAGSEKRGPEHAHPDLFQGRLVVLTPTTHTDPQALARTAEFWQALGARVRSMEPEEHDQALALTSHLPHLLAAALAGILPEALHDLTATGFRSTTRVAAGDPALWTGIFEQNRQALLDSLTILEARLAEFRRALETNDRHRLDDLLTQARRIRDALGN